MNLSVECDSQKKRVDQTVSFVVLASLAVFCLLVSLFSLQIPLNVQIWTLAALLVVIGIPHGAYDLPQLLASKRPYFNTLIYVFLGALMASLYFYSPFVWLVVFLIVTMLHFGLSDFRPRKISGLDDAVEIMIRGCVVFIPMAVLQKDAMIQIIAFLVPAAEAQAIVSLLGMAFIPFVALFAALLAWRFLNDRLQSFQTLELIVLLTAFTILPITLSFSLYFAGIHALRHILYEPDSHDGKTLGLVTIATIVAFGISGLAYTFLKGSALDPGKYFASAMVVLSGLTLPHMAYLQLRSSGREV
jgi:beta-carotene 15,15'-dioxygenase